MFSAAPRSWKQLWCRDEGLVYCYMEFEISKPCAGPLVKQASSVVGNPHRQPCKAGSVSGAAKAGPTCFHVRIYPVLFLRIITTFIFTIVSYVMKTIYRSWLKIWHVAHFCPALSRPVLLSLFNCLVIPQLLLMWLFTNEDWTKFYVIVVEPKKAFSSKTLTSCSATNNILRAKTFPPGWPWVLYTCLCLQTIERCGWCRDQTREPTSPPSLTHPLWNPYTIRLASLFGG